MASSYDPVATASPTGQPRSDHASNVLGHQIGLKVPFDQVPHDWVDGFHTTVPMAHDWVDGFHTTGAFGANDGGGGAGGALAGAAAEVAVVVTEDVVGVVFDVALADVVVDVALPDVDDVGVVDDVGGANGAIGGSAAGAALASPRPAPTPTAANPITLAMVFALTLFILIAPLPDGFHSADFTPQWDVMTTVPWARTRPQGVWFSTPAPGRLPCSTEKSNPRRRHRTRHHCRCSHHTATEPPNINGNWCAARLRRSGVFGPAIADDYGSRTILPSFPRSRNES
jgi:hypothetical protein